MKINLERLVSQADTGAFDGVTLTATSAATVSAVLDFLAIHNNWQGIGYELTTAEIDEIDEIVGQLSTDITT